MATHTTACLFDIPGLDGLAEVCSEFNVRLTAHGGLVRRLILRLPAKDAWQSLSFDLFDLSPFASDIDLIHDGPDALTPRIQDSIYRHVPNAECFRWELRSAASRTTIETAVRFNNFIPATLMRLSTFPGSGIWDPWDGWGDIKASPPSYRFIRNGFYKESPLYKAGKDLELFSALLYLQVVLEAGVSADILTGQPGMKVARFVIGDFGSDLTSVIALQESAYLRSRLLYLFKNLVTAAHSAAALDAALDASDFNSLQQSLNQHIGSLGASVKSLYSPPPKSVATTGRVGGDVFRLPHTTDAWTSDDASELLGDVLKVSQQLKGVGVDEALGAEQTVLLASPLIPVSGGRTPSARTGTILSDSANPAPVDTASPFPATDDVTVHEFVHFAVALSDGEWQTMSAYDDASLTAVLVIHAGENGISINHGKSRGCVLFPVPCACHLRRQVDADQEPRPLFVRCNGLRILEDAGLICRCLNATSKPYLQVFVLGLSASGRG